MRYLGCLWGKQRKGILCSFLALGLAALSLSGLRFFSHPRLAASVEVLNEDTGKSAHLLRAYGRLPLIFEANQGQASQEVRFLSRGSGYLFLLTSTGEALILSRMANTQESILNNPAVGPQPSAVGPVGSLERLGGQDVAPLETDLPVPQVHPVGLHDTANSQAFPSDSQRHAQRSSSKVLRMELIGANPQPKGVGLERLAGETHYFFGNDPNQWRTHIPTYTKVQYTNVYPGVDLVYYGNQGQLEHDFIVAPGVDPHIILLRFEGSDFLEVDERGDLVVHLADGQLRLHKPIIYQEVDGIRKPITGGYILNAQGQVGFQIAAYDVHQALVIDPVLSYSTYLGGTGIEGNADVALDSFGNAYVAGTTPSTDFPTMNPFQSTSNGSFDLFVAKLDPTGSVLVYSTYLGGSGTETGRLTVDGLGNAYLIGTTTSLDFPTASPFQASHGGGPSPQDAFVTKLNPTGSALVYSSYLGGLGDDRGIDIAVDGSGNAYIVGDTGNAIFNNFPTTAGAFQTSPQGTDGFVAQLDATGSTLVYSTFLGGSGLETAASVVVNNSGNAYIVGSTDSTDFPVVNAFQSALGGGSDLFVTKLNTTGTTLVYSTYLGGNSDDEAGVGIAIDSSENAYVTGSTQSTDFPTANPFQGVFGGGFRDAVVTKLNPTGSVLVYSTYLGGSDDDIGRSIGVTSAGGAYVVGDTQSTDFPTMNPIQSTLSGGFDAFVVKFNPSGSVLDHSTYLGGNGSERGTGIATDASGNLYVAGGTVSTNFPTKNPVQDMLKGIQDSFVAKIDMVNDPPVALSDGPFLGVEGFPVQMDASASSDPENEPLTFNWVFGDSSTLVTTQAAIEHTYPNPGTFTVSLVVNDSQLDSLAFITQASIGFTGGGQRSDVNAFLAYISPVASSTTLSSGTTSFDVTLLYGETIDAQTFQAVLNGQPVGGFTPIAGTSQTVSLPLSVGRNVLLLSVDGTRSDGRIATDRDRLVLIVP